MKITEQEFERGGNKKKRIVFSVGFEEIEILYAVLVRTSASFPILKEGDEHALSRIKNMIKAMSVYLGKTQPKEPKNADTACPYCRRQVRGENALKLHLKDVHPYETDTNKDDKK